MWQVHCTAPRTIWHFWAQPPLLTLQFSSPVRGPVPAKPEMGVEPRILPQTANLAFHLDHEEQLPGLQESPGRILFEPYGWGSATNHGPGPPTGDTHGSSAVGFRRCCHRNHWPHCTASSVRCSARSNTGTGPRHTGGFLEKDRGKVGGRQSQVTAGQGLGQQKDGSLSFSRASWRQMKRKVGGSGSKAGNSSDRAG